MYSTYTIEIDYDLWLIYQEIADRTNKSLETVLVETIENYILSIEHKETEL